MMITVILKIVMIKVVMMIIPTLTVTYEDAVDSHKNIRRILYPFNETASDQYFMSWTIMM